MTQIFLNKKGNVQDKKRGTNIATTQILNSQTLKDIDAQKHWGEVYALSHQMWFEEDSVKQKGHSIKSCVIINSKPEIMSTCNAFREHRFYFNYLTQIVKESKENTILLMCPWHRVLDNTFKSNCHIFILDTCCLMETGIVHSKFLGVQRQVRH